MKKKFKMFLTFAIALIVTSILCGCENISTPEIPFSDVKWDDTLSDIIDLYGNYSDKYDSSYGGPCYVYEGTEYNNLNGNTRYFFNENHLLVCVEFYTTFPTVQELDSAYEAEKERLTKAYGNSGYQVNESGVKGENWYREEGNIGILAVYVFAQNELQITYVNSIISVDEETLTS